MSRPARPSLLHLALLYGVIHLSFWRALVYRTFRCRYYVEVFNGQQRLVEYQCVRWLHMGNQHQPAFLATLKPHGTEGAQA